MGINIGISLLNSIYSSSAANTTTQQKQLSGQYGGPRMLFISGTNTDVSTSTSSSGATSASTQQTQVSGQQNPAYNVTISAAAKAASELDAAGGLPKWFNKYDAPLNDTSSALANKMTNDWSQQRSALQTELNQYGEYTHTAFLAAMKAVGATDGRSYTYNQMVASDPSVADRAEAVFKQTLLSMPNASSLMSRLSVPAASVS